MILFYFMLFTKKGVKNVSLLSYFTHINIQSQIYTGGSFSANLNTNKFNIFWANKNPNILGSNFLHKHKYEWVWFTKKGQIWICIQILGLKFANRNMNTSVIHTLNLKKRGCKYIQSCKLVAYVTNLFKSMQNKEQM